MFHMFSTIKIQIVPRVKKKKIRVALTGKLTKLSRILGMILIKKRALNHLNRNLSVR